MQSLEGLIDVNKIFWEAARLWEIECKRELKKKGFKPSIWEVGADGSITRTKKPYRQIKDAVTPWKNSPYYIDVDITKILDSA